LARGKLKKLFPGGNTSQGFYSYYDYIIPPDATRIFIIKGGPGVGKSTLMRSIGETMLEMGYDVEYHCCSSDNGSLDGVCIPQIGVALIDGTAPHVVDPKNPGAVDEIVHLGDYWDEGLMRQNKKAILKSNRRVGRLFQMAYFSLKEAKAIHEEWESYITEATDFGRVNESAVSMWRDIFSGVTPNFREQGHSRHLFANAITPDGPMNYLDTILQETEKLYVIKGEPGSGKATIISKTADLAKTLGLFTEVYHCSFVPQNVDVVVIPELSTAVANLSAPVSFEPSCLVNLKSCIEIDLSAFLSKDTLALYSDEINSCRERFKAAFDRSVHFIGRAKAEHDLMESYYIPAMNFAAINAKKEEILTRVLRYAEKVLLPPEGQGQMTSSPARCLVAVSPKRPAIWKPRMR